MEERKLIAKYIVDNCMYLPGQLMFGKLPGTRYSSQYYLANALYNTQFMHMVANQFYEIIKESIGNFDFQLAGREWTSIPLLTSLPMYMSLEHQINLNSFMIRKERKLYGRHNYIEGIPNSLPVLMVDDLCNSQDGFWHCHKVLIAENIETLPYIFAVLNKYTKNISPKALLNDRYLGEKYKILSIVTGDDINDAR